MIDIKDNINQFEIKFLGDKINLLKETKTIYYSNILNENDLYLNEFRHDVSYSYTMNISTSFLLNQRKLIETNIYTSGAESKTNFDKIYRSFRIQQIQNSILMIKAELLTIPFKLPEKLVIKNIDFKPHIENLLTSVEDEESNKYKIYSKILQIIRQNNSDSTIFENYLSTNLVISFLLELLTYPDDNTQDYIYEILNSKETSSLSNFYENVKKKMLNMDANRNFVRLDFIRGFFENSQNILNTLLNIEQTSINGYQIELSILDNDFDFLDSYLKIAEKSVFFLDISWRGISSGEETFLYQFSIFYYLSKEYGQFMNLKIDNRLENTKNLIILIDEGEITLHPQWQKDYIDYLVKFVRKIFTQNIHIILTTHSPFILSDIRNENIIFLNKYKKEDIESSEEQEIGNCKVLENGITEKTFGANIHTLLSNGFFMEDGLIGKFSQKMINRIFKYLNKEVNTIPETKEDIKSIIDSIGEPILSNKLTELYNEFYDIDTKEKVYLDEISELKDEIERLKNANN